jgi:DNA-binding PadR family transcriptional regulator
VVLLAVARLTEEAYGVAIRREIEERSRREVAIGSVYAALDRLERKGLVLSRIGDPTPERGGRAKRFFELSPAGTAALLDAREILHRFWEGLGLDSEAPV